MTNTVTTLDEKPQPSAQLQEAIACARQSLELGTQRNSFDLLPSRSSLDMSRSRRSSYEHSRSASRQSGDPKYGLDADGLPAEQSHERPRATRLSFDSSRDRIKELSGQLSIPAGRRSAYVSPRRLSVVKQGIQREYPLTAEAPRFEAPRRRDSYRARSQSPWCTFHIASRLIKPLRRCAAL
jgi:hypothetical protein